MTRLRHIYRSLRSRLRQLVIRVRFSGVRFGRHVVIDSGVRIRASGNGTVSIGDHVFIGRGSLVIAKRGTIQIGDHTHLSHGLTLVCQSAVAIGENGLVGEYVTIRDQNHGIAPGKPYRLQPARTEAIQIGENVWIGAHSSVLAGSRIGRDCVVGANSVVRGELEPGCVYAGQPAGKVKTIRSNDPKPNDPKPNDTK